MTLQEDILMENINVEPLNSRGHFGLRTSDMKKVTALIVVVYLSKNIYNLALVFNSLSELDLHKNLCRSETNVLKVIFLFNCMMHY